MREESRECKTVTVLEVVCRHNVDRHNVNKQNVDRRNVEQTKCWQIFIFILMHVTPCMKNTEEIFCQPNSDANQFRLGSQEDTFFLITILKIVTRKKFHLLI